MGPEIPTGCLPACLVASPAAKHTVRWSACRSLCLTFGEIENGSELEPAETASALMNLNKTAFSWVSFKSLARRQLFAHVHLRDFYQPSPK